MKKTLFTASAAFLFGCVLAGSITLGEDRKEATQYQCATDSECEALTGIPLEEAMRPRLVGYGCEGDPGPVYRMEEDDFWRCERIEPVR